MTEIRHLQGEEMLDAMFNLGMYAFHASPPFPDKEEWAKGARQRRGITYHAMMEDDAALSGAGSTAMTQNIRGTLYPSSGVWGVATHPGARRKGYCKAVMASLLAAEYEAGKVFSNLYPFRESFYERLGYVTLSLPVIAKLSPPSLTPLMKNDLGGVVELKLIGDAFEIYREYLAQMTSMVHGMAYFNVGDKHVADRNKQWVALAKVNGELEGIMLYSLQGEELSKYNFNAFRFYYKTSRGRYLLLDWIARHVDQADRAEIWLPAFERPESWLPDILIKVESQDRAPMGRVLNVAQIGGMQTGPGCFTAHISDPICPFNEGDWLFESVDSKLRVSKTSGANFGLAIQGLTGLVYGTHDPRDFSIRGWGAPSVELQSVMRSMFPPQMPFLHEYF
jgi:predicted acetyltransferase